MAQRGAGRGLSIGSAFNTQGNIYLGVYVVCANDKKLSKRFFNFVTCENPAWSCVRWVEHF